MIVMIYGMGSLISFLASGFAFLDGLHWVAYRTEGVKIGHEAGFRGVGRCNGASNSTTTAHAITRRRRRQQLLFAQ